LATTEQKAMEKDDEIITEAEKTLKRVEKIEEKAEHSLHNIEKYFDRINDKLFSYQLFILAGYISLVVIPNIHIHPLWLLIPFFCIISLICVDYNMMEYHRKFSKIMEMSAEQRNQISEKSNKATFQSLVVMFESAISTGVLFWLLCKTLY
jgi:hypothetical protein